MEARAAAGLTGDDGRRFGVTVGAAFLACAAMASWRGHPTVSAALAVVGAAGVVAGLLAPTHLGPIERGWMALAHGISRVTTPVVMGLMYVAVFVPIGLIRRTFGGNPLVHGEWRRSFWRERPEGMRRSRDMRRQF